MNLSHTPAHGRLWRACAEALENRRLLSATLVKDINTGTADSSPIMIGTAGDRVYFQAASQPGSLSLYSSDGTDAGTQPIQGGWAAEQRPTTILQLGSGKILLPFSTQLWELDSPSAQPVLIKQFDNFPGQYTLVGGKMFFSYLGDLWVSDGTAAGTVQVTHLPNGINSIAPLGNRVIFSTINTNAFPTTSQVFISDGTAAGTIALSGQLTGQASVAAAGSKAYFAATGGIWQTDGTPAGTSPVTSAPTGPYDFLLRGTPNKMLFFNKYDPSSQSDLLYATDGTATHLLAPTQIQLMSGDSAFIGNRLIFFGSSGPQWGVWSSDGTAAGTVLLEPMDRNTSLNMTQSASAAYFSYDDKVHGWELWKSDGTPTGTTLVRDINPYGSGLPPINSGPIEYAGGEVFFPATEGIHGIELWKSDGTSAGTVLVKDINTLPASSNPSNLSDVNGTLYFAATDDHGTQPWTSDGTSAGTQRLGVISTQDFFSPGPFIADGSKTFFMDNVHHQLWITDGTAAGTSTILSVDYTIDGLFDTSVFTVSGGDLYFFTDLLANGGVELWKSDGTAAGTQMLKSLQVVPSHLLPLIGGGVEFLMQSDHTVAAWKSDGTPAGTTTLGSPQTFGNDVAVLNMLTVLPTAGFQNGDYFVGVEIFPPPPIPPNPPPQFPPVYQLWRVGPSGNLKILQQLLTGVSSGAVNLNGTMLFLANDTVYQTDGTVAGTTPVKTLRSPGTGGGIGDPQLTVSGNRAFFLDYSLGVQLWVTDGTAAGTNHVGDVVQPKPFTPANGSVFFQSAGGQIWVSDGTTEGTAPIATYNTASTQAIPDQLVVSGSHLFFATADPTHGRELWAADLAGSISGSVFDDANHDGIRQATEGGLAGVTVYLDTNNNGRIDPGEPSMVTGSDGAYAFTGLQPGAAVVRQVPPAGWRRTTPLADSATTVVHPALASTGPIFGDVQVSTVPMDFNYLLTLAQHYGQPGTFAIGDVTGDGQVNFDDLLLLAQNYGHTLPAGTATVAAADSSLLLRRSRSATKRIPVR